MDVFAFGQKEIDRNECFTEAKRSTTVNHSFLNYLVAKNGKVKLKTC